MGLSQKIEYPPAEVGVPGESLAAAARNVGIPVRYGINSRLPPASLGRPDAFPSALWTALHAEQRFRRLLAIPGQPSLDYATRQFGIRHAILAGQVR